MYVEDDCQAEKPHAIGVIQNSPGSDREAVATLGMGG